MSYTLNPKSNRRSSNEIKLVSFGKTGHLRKWPGRSGNARGLKSLTFTLTFRLIWVTRYYSFLYHGKNETFVYSFILYSMLKICQLAFLISLIDPYYRQVKALVWNNVDVSVLRSQKNTYKILLIKITHILNILKLN